MSINTAHANNGVLIHAGESILLFSDNVTMDFDGNQAALLKGGSRQGRIYLTTHRMIFNNKKSSDGLQSFSFPFVALSNVNVEQPVFGSNYIRGTVQAQENGNWQGRASFKLNFKAGGAIDFAQTMLKAVQMARRNYHNDAPPPYVPPNGDWFAAPPPAYSPNPQGYYGWLPSTQAFPNQPPPNSVYMHDMPPPYPGIAGFPQQGPTPQQPFYDSGAGAAGWANGAGGSYVATPQQQPSYNPGYPSQPMGFNPMPGQNAGSSASNDVKSQEAAQSAYFAPNQPQTAYVPPPAYYEQPPSYNTLNK